MIGPHCSVSLRLGRVPRLYSAQLGAGQDLRIKPRGPNPCMGLPPDQDFSDDATTGDRRMALRALVSSLAVVASHSTGIAFAEVDWGNLDDQEWKKRLSPDSYKILRNAGTEMPFSSALNKEYRSGVFCCAGCGSPLFDSSSKFNSGTGWPSFTQALPGAVDEANDFSIVFMPRTEVTCHTCHGHLGHVFPDGPAPTGLRYCMNGVALTFVPS